MDRFFRGFTAGIVGGVLMQIWSFFSFHVLGLTKLRFMDWAAIIVFGEQAETILEAIFALFAHLLFAGFLGMVFAFLLPQVTSRLYLLKGVLFGIIVGFFIYAIPMLLQTPRLTQATLGTALTDHIGGVIWGLATAYTLARLSRREELLP